MYMQITRVRFSIIRRVKYKIFLKGASARESVNMLQADAYDT